MIAWTDTRSSQLGMARSAGADISALYAWWQADGKPLGRAPDDGPAPVKPGTGRPLVRVPGAPNDVICTSLEDAIVDPYGRTWQLERVRFLVEPGYERVVLALERRGPIRDGKGAEVTVDRFPAADLPTEFPGAPRTGRGLTVLAVRMEGVVQAPDLRSYRPQGLDLVRELSVVRGARTRTALLSLAGDGCYQVRVPVFGPSATGNEDRAEVFIDIPR